MLSPKYDGLKQTKSGKQQINDITPSMTYPCDAPFLYSLNFKATTY